MGINRQEEQFDFSALEPKKDEATVTDAVADVPERESAEHFDEVGSRAVRAAEALMAHAPLPDSSEPSAAERAYDLLNDQAERASDLGLDFTGTRKALNSESGAIEAYERELARKQDALNHVEAEKIRQDRFNAQLAAIEAIANPEERRRTKIEFLARTRAADERRGRRW